MLHAEKLETTKRLLTLPSKAEIERQINSENLEAVRLWRHILR